MIEKELLKSYANSLMFDMNDEEYETLQKEFDVLLKQMDWVAKNENLVGVEPMTFCFEQDNVTLRSDDTTRTISVEDAFKNAKEVKDREVKVPKVVE